jgi:hypothetical protein
MCMNLVLSRYSKNTDWGSLKTGRWGPHFVNFTKYYKERQIKEGQLGGICGVYGGEE